MPVFQVDYDLHAPDKNYGAVIAAIKSHDGWCPVLKSCWLVAGARLTLDEVWATMLASIDKNDRLLVTRFTRPYQGWLPKDTHAWIDQHVPA